MTEYRIVTKTEADALPVGSVILLDMQPGNNYAFTHPNGLTKVDATNWIGARIRDTPGPLGSSGLFKVLYTPEPVPVKVGDVLDSDRFTVDLVESFKVGTVLLDGDGDPAIRTPGGWVGPMGDDLRVAGELHDYLTIPVRVLNLPAKDIRSRW